MNRRLQSDSNVREQVVPGTSQFTEIKLVRLAQVRATTGLSKTSIYEKIKNDAFPPPVPIGKRAVAWIESEIQQWATDQIMAARSAGNYPVPKRMPVSYSVGRTDLLKRSA